MWKLRAKVNIEGGLYAKNRLRLQGRDISVVDSNLVSFAGTNISSKNQLYTSSSNIISHNGLSISAKDFVDDFNSYRVDNGVEIRADTINSRLSNLATSGSVALSADGFISKATGLFSDDELTISTRDEVDINGGEIFSKENIRINSRFFNLTGLLQLGNNEAPSFLGKIVGQEIEITAKEQFSNRDGIIQAEDAVVLNSPKVINLGGKKQMMDKSGQGHKFWYGSILSRGDIHVAGGGLLENSGLIEGSKKVNLEIDKLKNSGLINSGNGTDVFSISTFYDGALEFFDKSPPSIINKGTISSGVFLDIDLGSDKCSLHVRSQIENEGYLVSKRVVVTSDYLENAGSILSDSNLDLNLGIDGILNRGSIQANNISKIHSREFHNSGDKAELRSRYLDLTISNFTNEGAVTYGKICDDCIFLIDSFANSGNITSSRFDLQLRDEESDLSLGGIIRAGLINVTSLGNVELEESSSLIGLSGVELSGGHINTLGALDAPFIKIEVADKFSNSGNITSPRRFIFTGDSFVNQGVIRVGAKNIIESWLGAAVEKAEEAEEKSSGSLDNFESSSSVKKTIFQAKISKKFLNNGDILVGEKLSEDSVSKNEQEFAGGLLTVEGADADVDIYGRFLTNHLRILGRNIGLGGTKAGTLYSVML